MELTALIMDNRTKKVKQFSLPVELEYVASEFGYDVEDVSTTIQSIEELPDLDVERSPLFVFNELAEKFGRDVRLEEGGSFVDKGYFVSR